MSRSKRPKRNSGVWCGKKRTEIGSNKNQKPLDSSESRPAALSWMRAKCAWLSYADPERVQQRGTRTLSELIEILTFSPCLSSFRAYNESMKENECICDGDVVTLWDCPCDECQEIREDYEDDLLDCPACGLENSPTGQLGKRKHYNCRDCGIWYSA